MANCSGSNPSSLRLRIAGSSLLRVRSPDAPKITKTQGSAWFDIATGLRAKRGEQSLRERVVAPRSEPPVERRCQHVRRHFFFHRRMDSPPPLTGIGDAPGKLLEL